jgi:signal transduction histidine kinase/ActR/RegA family two-component response regulator
LNVLRRPSDEQELAIRRELVGALFAQGRLAALLSAVAFLLAVLMLGSQIGASALALWASCGIAVIATRLAVWEMGDRLFDTLRSRVCASVACIGAMGCLWGSMVLFWHPDLTPAMQLLITVFPLAVSIGSVTAYANWLPAFFSMALPAQLPLVALFALHPDPQTKLLVLPTLTFIVGQVFVVRRMHAQLRESVVLKFGNEALVHDLSSRNNELHEAHKLASGASETKSEFLARMSHEFRTPLNGVIGMTNALAATDLDTNQRASLELLAASSNEMLSLVNELLDATLLHADAMRLAPVAVSPQVILDTIDRSVRPLAAIKGLSLSFTIDKGVPAWLHADPDRLRQIIFSLVDNAVKYTDTGSVELRLGAARGDNPRLHVIVEDTGVGIPADRIAAVYELFTQADGFRNRKQRGMGVGLTVTRQLVELMGGTIDLSSTPDVGTRFMVELPMTEAEAPRTLSRHFSMPRPARTRDLADEFEGEASPSLGADTPTRAALGDRIDVLVVEDNSINQLVLKSMLCPDRMDVRFADNGKQAIHAVDARVPDLILMDCQMPVMDGFDATGHIRGRGIDVPIIAVTANALAGDRERCLTAGMNDYIAKPLDPRELEKILARWLGDRLTDALAA